MFLAFFPLCPFVCLVVEKRFPLQTVDPILRKPSRRSRAFLKSVEFIFFPLIHANPSTRSGQVYANFETIREDWRRHLHVRQVHVLAESILTLRRPCRRSSGVLSGRAFLSMLGKSVTRRYK
jgi:hypothetical protein